MTKQFKEDESFITTLLKNFIGAFGVIFISVVFGFWIGVASQKIHMQEKAVEIDVAEYFLDENNEKQFRWLPPENEN